MRLSETTRLVLAIIIILIIYSVIAFIFLPPRSFFSGDEGVKFLQIENLVRKGWRDVSIDYPGKVFDPTLRFNPITPPYGVEKNGRVYSNWPILYPFLASFFFRFFGFYGLYIIPIFSSIGTALILAKINRHLHGRYLPSSVFLLCLVTPMFFYSLVLWEHSFATLVSVLSVYFLLKTSADPAPKYFFLSGLFLALAIWVRNELYALIPVLLLAYGYVWGWRSLDYKKTVRFFLGLFLILIPMWFIQKFTVGEFLGGNVGQFLKTGMATEIAPYLSSLSSVVFYRLYVIATLLFHPFSQKENILYALPYLFLIAAILLYRFIKKEYVFYPLFVAAVYVSSVALFAKKISFKDWFIFGLFPSPSIDSISSWLAFAKFMFGLFPSVTFVIFSLFVYLMPSANKKKSLHFLLLVALLLTFFILLLSPSTGGVQSGPRFLLPAITLFAAGVISLFLQIGKLPFTKNFKYILKVTLVLFIAMSFAVQTKSVYFLYLDKREGAGLLEYLNSSKDDVFITDTFWFPQEAAPVFYTKKYFFVKNADDFNSLIKIIVNSGINKFAYATYYGNPHQLWPDSPTLSKYRFTATGEDKVPNGILVRHFERR